MLQIGHRDPLKIESDFLEVQGCTLHTLTPQDVSCLWYGLIKYKVGYIDLILIKHHIHLKNLKT